MSLNLHEYLKNYLMQNYGTLTEDHSDAVVRGVAHYLQTVVFPEAIKDLEPVPTTITQNDIRDGSMIQIRPDFGSGEPITVEVIGIGTHKGKVVVDYNLAGPRWAYLSQIDKVVTF